jgi:diacylglycerol kinase (ATP)
VLTSAPWDGERLARAAIGDGVDTIVAVGGDGTVHEIVNGFFEDRRLTPQVKLAILPSGTGMDFARNLRIRRGVRAAVDRILSGEERRVDVGLVPDRGRVFVNFAETGLGAAVVAREREYSSAWPGRASFFMAAVAAALDEDNVVVRISIDGSSVYEGPVVSVVVANGRYFGGGMKIAPRASMDDGLLDVFVLGDFTRLERVSQIWKIYPGVHVGLSKVLWKRAQTVEIEPVGPSRLDLDGELLGGGAVRLALLPASLRVVA